MNRPAMAPPSIFYRSNTGCYVLIRESQPDLWYEYWYRSFVNFRLFGNKTDMPRHWRKIP